MVDSRRYAEALPDPAETLERYFTAGGTSLLHAVFENTFFVDPAVVRERMQVLVLLIPFISLGLALRNTPAPVAHRPARSAITL